MGTHSFFDKMAAYDPTLSSPIGKYIDPVAAGMGQRYRDRLKVGSTPTPYAGVNPTLADANNGYVQAAKKQIATTPVAKPVGGMQPPGQMRTTQPMNPQTSVFQSY